MPSFDDPFRNMGETYKNSGQQMFGADNLVDKYKDQAQVALNQITGAAAGFSSAIVDSAYQTGKNILDLTAYLSTFASKVISRPMEVASGMIEAGSTWVNSSLHEIATGIPTNPMWYIKQGLKFGDNDLDSQGRKKPYPNTIANKSPQESKYNPFTGQLMNPINNIIESGKDLIRNYDFTGKLFSPYSSPPAPGNEYKSISYIIKPMTTSEIEEMTLFSVYNTIDGKNTLEAYSEYKDVTIFDVMKYCVMAGGGYYSCTIEPYGGGIKDESNKYNSAPSLAPKFYHFSGKKVYPYLAEKKVKNPANALTWLPIAEPPSIKFRDVSAKDSINTMTNPLYYSLQLKKAERIEITLVENTNLDIINYLERYRKVIFPDDNTYVTRPLKEIVSVFTYYVYTPLNANDIQDGAPRNSKKLIRALKFLVVPEFSETYDDSSDVKRRNISFIVVGE